MNARRKSGITLHGVSGLLMPLILLWLLWKTHQHREKVTTVIKTIHDVLAASGYSESFIRIATAQAAHETAFFTSRVFFENNNLFGMKVPRLRETKALYTKNGHAVFESVEDSVKDYILYLKKQNISPNSLNPDQFVTLLAQKGYFEAPLEEYLTGVNHFIKKIYG